MPPPLAYFLTWTTYGTWLPGDDRGWVDKHHNPSQPVIRPPDRATEMAARSRMAEESARLDGPATAAVSESLRETCRYRGWRLHALSVQSSHVHVVVSAGEARPERVLQALKAYASRALARLPSLSRRQHWWTEGGSKRFLNDQRSFEAAVAYVERQDGAPPLHSGGL